MRVRAQDATGDMLFGQGGGNFLVDSPEAVAQLVSTRLQLWEGEWFLDTTEGTPWTTQILGSNTQQLYDLALSARMLDTPGVIAMSTYNSHLNPTTRTLAVTASLVTQYGTTAALSLPIFNGV